MLFVFILLAIVLYILIYFAWTYFVHDSLISTGAIQGLQQWVSQLSMEKATTALKWAIALAVAYVVFDVARQAFKKPKSSSKYRK